MMKKYLKDEKIFGQSAMKYIFDVIFDGLSDNRVYLLFFQIKYTYVLNTEEFYNKQNRF